MSGVRQIRKNPTPDVRNAVISLSAVRRPKASKVANSDANGNAYGVLCGIRNSKKRKTTKNGALLVCDQVAGCGDFQPGSTTMTDMFATETPGSYGVALDKREKNAWVEDPSISGAQLERFKYPGPDKRAKQVFAVPGGGYAGVALSPASPQGRPY